jgi:hypothetical protein
MKRLHIYLSLMALLAAILLQLPARAQFAGGNGRGEAATTLNGVDLKTVNVISSVMHCGGSGKGDAIAASPDNIYLTDKLFTGNTSTDFSLGANWTGGTFPSSETGIVPPTATRQPVLSGSQTITAGTIVSVLEGASLTIAPPGLLTVNGVLNNTGTVTLQSNATGSGGIGNSSGTITGNITVERFIPAVARRYRMYAPSITNFDYSQLIDDIFVTGPSGGTGFDPTTHSNNPSIFTYQQDTTGGRGWKSFNNINTILANGTGALVFVRGDRTLPAPQWYTTPYVAQNAVTLDVTGTIRSGSVTTPLQYTNTNDTANDGWNLVGNPYPCAIDWSAITKNNITPFYYIYNPSSASYTVSNTGKIESGQSFFVQATAGGASLVFNESSKTTTGGAGLFKTMHNPFTVRLIKDAITYDEAVLQFSPAFKKTFRFDEDAIKLDLGGSASISFLEDKLKLHIQSVPFSQPAVSDTFVMNINGSAGTYTLRLSNIKELPIDKNVFLTDNWLNTVYPIAADTALQISITPDNASKGARFMLTFQPNTSLPAKLIAFSGNHEPGKGNRLFWTTASEENVREFIVERRNASDDIFTPIGAALATGKVNALTNYTYLDADADLTQPYIDYRLRTTDFSGLSELSKIITINVSADSDQPIAQMYPNPVKQGENVLVQYNNSLKGKITALKVYNASGLLMESADKTVEAVSTANLPAGVYMVEVWLGAAKEMIKLVVF